MRFVRLGFAAALLVCAAGAQAMTIIVYIEPMTLERHTHVIDTPGPDRLLMCMAPPSLSGCTELPLRRLR